MLGHYLCVKHDCEVKTCPVTAWGRIYNTLTSLMTFPLTATFYTRNSSLNFMFSSIKALNDIEIYSYNLFTDLDECCQSPIKVCDNYNAQCVNKHGSFACQCDEGFTGDPAKSCEGSSISQ